MEGAECVSGAVSFRKQRKIREKALHDPISTDNKGFVLLQKMGYKPGQAIGKSGTGSTEPIPFVVKFGRSGLGRDEEIREIRKQNKEKKKMKAQEKKNNKKQKAQEKKNNKKQEQRKNVPKNVPQSVSKRQKRDNIDHMALELIPPEMVIPGEFTDFCRLVKESKDEIKKIAFSLLSSVSNGMEKYYKDRLMKALYNRLVAQSWSNSNAKRKILDDTQVKPIEDGGNTGPLEMNVLHSQPVPQPKPLGANIEDIALKLLPPGIIVDSECNEAGRLSNFCKKKLRICARFLARSSRERLGFHEKVQLRKVVYNRLEALALLNPNPKILYEPKKPIKDVSLEVTIRSKNFPNEKLSQLDVEKILKEILRKIDEIEPGNHLPLFKSYVLKDGALIYSCEDQDTCSWVIKNFNEVKIDKYVLRVIQTEYNSELVKVCFHTKDATIEETNKFLWRIGKLNPGLQVKEWKVLYRHLDSNGQSFIFLIDKFSARIIKQNNLSAYTGVDMGLFDFEILDDSHTEDADIMEDC